MNKTFDKSKIVSGGYPILPPYRIQVDILQCSQPLRL
jgi:hypothetical protein